MKSTLNFLHLEKRFTGIWFRNGFVLLNPMLENFVDIYFKQSKIPEGARKISFPISSLEPNKTTGVWGVVETGLSCWP